MAKLARFAQKVFGFNAPSSEIGQVGSLANGAANTTTDPGVIQALGNYLGGWFDCVLGNNSPAMEDMNGLHFLITRQLAYIFQQGVAEWDTDTEYHQGSLVLVGSSLFMSKTNTNEGNDPLTSPTNWNIIPLTNASSRNYAYNAQFREIDFGSTVQSGFDYADGEFGPSHWIILSSSGENEYTWIERDNIGPEPTTESAYILQVHHAATGPSQSGLFQMLDEKRTHELKGKLINFRTSLGLYGFGGNEMRIGIIKWTGTGDAYNRDPIDTWNSGALPTLKTNFEFIASSDAFEPDNGGGGIDGMLEEYVSGTVSADTENVGILIWTDTAFVDASAGFYVGHQSIQLGAVPTAFETCAVAAFQDWAEKKRFYYDLSDPFSSWTGRHQFAAELTNSVSDSFTHYINYPVVMYKNPAFSFGAFTVTMYNGAASPGSLSGGTVAKNGASLAGTAPGATTIGPVVGTITNIKFDARNGV